MIAKVFCDTNIIVRLNILESPEHEQIKQAVEVLLARDDELWVSRQVIREFAAVITRPQTFLKPFTTAEAAIRTKGIVNTFRVADETASVTDYWLNLMERYSFGGRQIHDANIIATMKAYSISELFTLNVVDFARFAGEITILKLDALINDTNESN